MFDIQAFPLRPASTLLAATLFIGGPPPHLPVDPATLTAKLSEWKVELSATTVPAGQVTIEVTNSGSIPHAIEVEGPGLEKEIPEIPPGGTGSITVNLKPGTYEVYCPVGHDSHKKLGMETHLKVVAAKAGSMSAPERSMHDKMDEPAPGKIQTIQVSGGGPVIQILPGPFPFPDSAGPILQEFGEEHEALESQAQNGPYSNNVAKAAGTFRLTAWDKGAVRDSVDGVATFTTQDGAHWRLVLDRVQTKDVPHHPKFGGVIMGLYYHGNTRVHTPLVPTINSSVALWAFGHLYKNDALVSDNAMVHVMLLSRTRREGDWALACWDCSRNPIEELQLQITSAPGDPRIDAPGGFLFLNWEKSTSRSS